MTSRRAKPRRALPDVAALIPRDADEAVVALGPQRVRLTNLGKLYWPDDGITKGDLLRYYVRVAPFLLPHLRDRPMVLRRYPNGVRDAGFFMKNAPVPRPEWVQTCHVVRGERTTDFVLVQDLATLLWVANLGCIDLNPWYSRCDALDQPDAFLFDLDPGPEAAFAKVAEGALVVRDALTSLGIPAYAKTTGSRGIHVAVPIKRGPTQEAVWAFARALAGELTGRHPALFTVEYAKVKRPRDRVLLDYNQMANEQTLASIYSPRPKPRAPVSTPLTWAEVDRDVAIADFRIDNVPTRLSRRGDLWKPLLAVRRRFDLGRFV
jgi:bifunctional non-homologous end joining protein LigD